MFFSGIYLLVSVIRGAEELRAKGEALEAGVANLFRHHLETLVQERTLQLSRAKQELQDSHNRLELANAELYKTNRRLQALMEALPVGVSFSDDISCRSITGNPCLFAQLEMTSEDNISASAADDTAAGRHVRYFQNGRELKPTELPLQRAVAEQRMIPPVELEVLMPSGRRWFADVSGAPLLDEQGRIIGGIAVIVDITDRKRAEEELQKAHDELELRVRQRTEELQFSNAELQRSNADLQQFAYVASHDLQEPLRNVASCLQMLEKGYKNKLDATADQYINYAVEGAVRMKALILDLLEYSRVATKGKPPARIDSEKVLDSTLKNLHPAIAETGAVITHDRLPTIIGDDAQLLLVFQNLIGNAIKFRRDEPPRIHVSAVRNKNDWIFSIKDNGIGIESRHLDRIFVIFQRLHKRSEYDGTGMGLAIVKKIVERHGGKIWVESEPGMGSTFYFTILEKGFKYDGRDGKKPENQ